MDTFKYCVLIVTFIALVCVQNNLEAAVNDNCNVTADCIQPNETCINDKCACSPNYYKNGGNCYMKQSYGAVCTDDIICDDEGNTIECVQTTDPNTKRCLCKAVMYRTSSSCVNASTITPQLTTAVSARTSILINWGSNPATEYTAYYRVSWTGGQSQQLDASRRSYDIQNLAPGRQYSVSVSHVITKHDRTQTFTSAEESYATKQGYGGDCSSIPCDDAGSTISCDSTVNKCLCVNDKYWNSGQCAQASTITPQLTTAVPARTSILINWGSNPAPEYTAYYRVSWTGGQSQQLDASRRSYDIQNLAQGTPYTVSVSHVITKHDRTRTFTSIEQSYTTKQGYGGDCSSIPCDDAGGTISCDSTVNKCLCVDGKYWNGGQCAQDTSLTPVLPPSPSVGVDYIDLIWQASDTMYYTSYYTIKWSRNNSGQVVGMTTVSGKSHRIEGLEHGTAYLIALDRILESSGRNRTLNAIAKVYSTKIGYNEPCNTSGLCIDADTDCINQRCRCKPTFYRNTQCRSIEELKPNTTTAQVTGTTTMSVIWTSLDNAVITGYDVTTSPTETGINVVEGDKTATITGLTPGRLYTVSVKTKIIYLEGRDEMTSATYATPQRTTPEMVTRLDDTLTNLTAPVITIVFPNPVGDISSYIVNLQGIKGDTGYTQTTYPPYIQSSNTTSTIFSGVVASYEYRLTIKTKSGGVLSVPFTRNIKVKDKPAGQVYNFNKTKPTSRSVDVSWQRPEFPNGNLYQYTLEIMEDSRCKQLIIFNCTSCSANRSSEPNPSCDNTSTETIPEVAVKDDDYVINYTISTLLPSISYVLSIAAYNGEGKGMGKTLNVLTTEEAAGVPTDFDSTTQTASSITVTWNPPLPRPGNTFYNLTVYEWNEATRNFDFYNLTYFTDYESREFTIDGLSSYWNYSFTIQANTSKGASDIVNLPGSVRTKQSPPIQVEYIRISKIPEVFNRVRVEWKCPEGKDATNGPITSANVTYKIEEPTVDQTMSGSVKYPNPGNCLWEKEVTVTPEYNYTFTVFLINEFPGIERTTYRYIPAGPPDLTSTVVDVSAGQSETSVSILIFPSALHNGKNGRVILTGVVVCKGTCQTRKRRDAKDRSYYDSLPTWKQSKADNFVSPYRATPDNWIDDKKTTDRLDFKVGNDSSCNSAPDNVFCNGQLPRGTSFTIYVFACTDVGCSDSASIKVDTMETPTNIGLIAGVVGGVVAAIIIIIIVVLVVRYMRRPQTTKLDPEDTEEELIVKKRPIRICNFEKKVEEMHKDSNLLFSEEFEDINALSPKHACVASETGGNKLKNRYVNILPFDHSRVKLLPTEEDEEETDYINGNYIPGYRSQREYIATQGPMTGTVNDFWRMIWEQNVPIIVMLSDLSEKGKPKVDRYYPENMEPVQYGDIIVEMTNFSPLNKYVIRIFKLQLGDEIRMVRHYFLPGWQDFGANLTSDDVINFLKSVRMEIKPNNHGPLCIHCSAGVGRTGTYITLDVFQQYIDEEDMNKEMDIFDFTMKMRNNRSYMIQTEKQYIFVHDTIKEMIIRKKKEMSERDHIYQNHNTDDNNVYENQAFEADPQDIYMNVDSTGKPTTAL